MAKFEEIKQGTIFPIGEKTRHLPIILQDKVICEHWWLMKLLMLA